ncbi:MAG: cbb3-type cytochrome oxidase subunit 3 [Burkholderiaceae bacterium]
MTIANLLIDASSVMTVISFVTFIGILWWTFSKQRNADFNAAAMLPFADETDEADLHNSEKHHV